MKKIIFILLVVLLSSAALFVSCKPATKEEQVAKDNLEEAKDNVEDADRELVDARRQANAEEWASFKNDVNTVVEKNDAKIDSLKLEIKKSGKEADAAYQKRIDALKERNEELKVKIKTYKNDANSNWESFKREFNHDTEELGKSLKDFTVNNKK
jgi:exonuclease VII large subunit